MRPNNQRMVAGLQATASPVVSPAAIGLFFRRRRLAIALPILASLGLAYAYMQTATPIYTATTQLIIDPRLPQFIPGRNVDGVLAWDSTQVESEIAVLQSEHIARRVVSNLKLDQAEDFRILPSLLSTLLGRISESETHVKAEPDRFQEALSVVASGLNVRRTGLSYAINVTFGFPEPRRAQEVANAVADAYISDQLENKSSAARLGGEWLQQRMVSLRSQMNAASRAVSSFRASHNYDIPKTERTEATQTVHAAGPSTAAEATTLDELEASYVMYRRVYESFLQSFTESVQRQSFPVSDSHILADANLPLRRSSPRGVLIYPFAALIGCLAGFGLAIGLHQVDRTVRSSAQLAERVGIDGLGVLPRLQTLIDLNPVRLLARLSARYLRGTKDRRTGNARQQLAGWRRGWVRRRFRSFSAILQPHQTAFRSGMLSLKVCLDLASSADRLGCIGVVSSREGEGGSMVASNLAIHCAELGSRTLLIDAAIEVASITRHLKHVGSAGLAEVLAGTATFEEAVVPFAGTLFDVLPAKAPRSQHDSTVLFAKTAFNDLLRNTAQVYDTVVVDLPSGFPVTGALELTPLLDGVLVVVGAGRTTTDTVADLVDHLSRARAKVLGFALCNNGG